MKNQTTEPPRKAGSEPFAKVARNGGLPVFRILMIVVIIGAVAGTVWYFGGGEEKAWPAGSTYTVTRGDLLITVLEHGSLKAQRSVEIKSKVEGRATVVYLVPEGTYVKKDELLVDIDSADLEEAKTQQEIQYESALASFIQASESLAIQENQNQSDINAGSLAVEFGEKELNKYIEGGWPLEKSELENAITIADEELKRASNTVEWTRELEKKGFVTKDDLEADLLNLKKSEIRLEQAKEQLKLSMEYDQPMQLRKLQSDLDEAKLELVRIERRAISQVAQKTADKNSREAQKNLQESRFNKLKEQLINCKIYAPQDGLVVYGSQEGGGRHGPRDSEIIEEGADVRFRQTLITLPDVSVMVVNTSVHESAVEKVSVGQKANITVDAFPDLRFEGEVTKVAILPDSQSRWLNPDLKEYSTEVTMIGGNGKLKPGMSAMVEIIVARLDNVIYVPIQSVFRRKNREICYVPSGGTVEVRPVKVGVNNEQFVEIHYGMAEGEQVLLYEPALGEDLEGEEEGEAADKGQAPGKAERPARGREAEPTARDGTDRAEMRDRARATVPDSRKEFEKKVQSMTPEERKAFFEKMRAEGGGPAFMGGGSGNAMRRGEGGADRRGEGGKTRNQGNRVSDG